MPSRATQAILLFLRYAAALIVAFLASIAAFWFGAAPAEYLGKFGSFFLFALVGFAGVLSGTLCLPRSSRRLGSVFLLVVGLAFYLQFWLGLSYLGLPGHQGFPQFLPLVVGGATAAVVFFIPPRANPR
jgi:hypothetical protein